MTESTRNFRGGDALVIVCGGYRLAAHVSFASENGNSLMVHFDGMVDGHLGAMPLLRGDDGIYRSVLTGIRAKLYEVSDGSRSN
jgi:hypothetical protein